MVKKITKLILEGLAIVLPMAVTLYIIWWLVDLIENQLVGVWLKGMLTSTGDNGEVVSYYVPGMGLVLGLAAMIAIGIMARLYIVQRLLGVGDWIFERLPVAKTIYGAIKDFMQLFSGEGSKGFSEVVLVKVAGSNQRLLGMVTRDGFDELPDSASDSVGVYLPMSYQLGGYMVMVPRDSLEKVDMSIEEAMKFAMTGGVSTVSKPDNPAEEETPESSPSGDGREGAS